tara:strand:+ start:12854 stop:14815 length:1962 start_codon:yes stop_codon:yes gene_type:complete
MTLYTADVEANGLDADRIWCFHLTELDSNNKPVRSFVLHDYEKMKAMLIEPDNTFIMHYGVHYDFPTLERVLNISIKSEIIDTLALSWYLEPKRTMHGLAGYGEEFGVPKPVVEDGEWFGPGDDATPQEWFDFRKKMDHRCEEDVKIQTKLWQQQYKHLMLMYKSHDGLMHAVRHLTFKFRCAALQEKAKWKLDVPACKVLVESFSTKFDEAKVALEAGMPEVPFYTKRSRPKKPYKMDGTLSAGGVKWVKLVSDTFPGKYKSPIDCTEDIKVITKYNLPNAGSSKQLKAWLFSLGWEPLSFKFKRDKETGDVRQIPQIKDKNKGELCDSIERLIAATPALVWLREMSVVKHRLGVCEGFLRNVDDSGYVQALVQGFTNTLRFKHKVCLNLPSVRKPYGAEIRGLLTARDSRYELCGSDMSSLEDRTKQHYMWPHDPDYVRAMQVDGFDPHWDIALEAGMADPIMIARYKAFDVETATDAEKKDYFELSLIRHGGKSCNYAATYGAAGATIARAAGVDEAIGHKLHAAYWSRNWSLKAIADEQIVKKSRGLSWLWNPVAKMWIWLKNEKDRFSTLNQSTGTYCFDRWVWYILSKRPQLTGQFHDEVVLELKVDNREAMTKLLKWAVAQVNDELKLNRDLDVDVDFGRTYAAIH